MEDPKATMGISGSGDKCGRTGQDATQDKEDWEEETGREGTKKVLHRPKDLFT